MSGDLITVRDVYGALHRISREQYQSGRMQLSRFTATGMRFCDWHAQMGWRGQSTTLHRENIKGVLT